MKATIIEQREVLRKAMALGVSPTIEALASFLAAVDLFMERLNDYDEWDALHYGVSYGDSYDGPQPGFSLAKLHEMLGMDEAKNG